MTLAQKMLDERRMGYMDGMEEGREKGREEGLEEGFKNTIITLKDMLEPQIIAERFKMSLEQVMDILGQA